MILQLICLQILVGLCATDFGGQGDKVLLRDLTSITLYRGQYTTGRRSSPVAQLECVGGTAEGKFSPKAVQCYNRGWDGRDVQWECKAELPGDYQFGKIDVSCEGYDYPNDPYVLAGSCGLRYELDYSSAGAGKYAYTGIPSTHSMPSWFSFEKVVSALVILFVIYLVYLMLSSNGEPRAGNTGGSGGGGGWGPGPDGRRPPPPGWNPPPPPSYDEATGSAKGANTGSSSSGGAASGPGFYSGLGLGALGGYFFGRTGPTGYDGYGGRYRGRGGGGYGGGSSSYFDNTGSGFGSGPSTSSSSSGAGSSHTSTGFGGTSRR